MYAMISLILQVYLPVLGLALAILNSCRSAFPQKVMQCIYEMLFALIEHSLIVYLYECTNCLTTVKLL